MAYIGLTPITQSLSTNTEYFSGDGTTLQFTLSQGVGKASDIIVMVGSTLQRPGVNYTASSTSLVFAAGNAPTAGTDNITVSYIAGSLNTVFISANAYPAGTTTAPAIYTQAAASTGIYWPSTTSLAFTAAGNTRVTVSDAALGVASSTTTGALRVNGGLGVSGATYVGGTIFATASTESTNSATGALVVSGGVGVTKNMFLNGSMTIAGGLTVAGAFNTTSTTSLIINTPFLFVANTNVSDSVDQGLVGTYNDGTQRYTGIYRAQSDGKWKVFTNLTAQPTTLVDAANVSYRYGDFWMGNANVTATTSSTTATTGALTVWGGIGARGSMYLNSLNNAIAIGNGGTSGTGNIGASGATFNTIFAQATTAQYADLAEKYTSDAAYEPGTVMCFSGKYEVTECNVDMYHGVAGVVSTKPGFLLNEGLEPDSLNGEYAVELALIGRVPCKVTGTIQRGDMLVSAGAGRARSEAEPKIGTVIGKALEDFNGDQGVIEIVVGKN